MAVEYELFDKSSNKSLQIYHISCKKSNFFFLKKFMSHSVRPFSIQDILNWLSLRVRLHYSNSDAPDL